MCKIKQARYLSFLIFCIALAGIAYAIAPAKDTPQSYLQVFTFAKKEETTSATNQVRYGVEKTHFGGGTAQRDCVHIACEKSVLQLNPIKGLGQSIEEMENINAQWKSTSEHSPSYQLQAQQAVFYPKKSHIVMQKISAQPQPHSPLVTNRLEVIDAGSAEYDGSILHLTDNVKARFETIEILAGQARILPKKTEQKTEVSKIQLENNVTINSLMDATPFSIKSPQIEWDLDTNVIVSNGTPDQVSIEDPSSLIYGDNLTAYLHKENQTLSPKRIHLSGNVKIQKYTTSGHQYAIADSVDYNPLSREWELAAIPPHRVLYYDKQNSITISAPKIIVKQNSVAAKPHVKALGDVRFVFAEQELTELMSRFQAAAIRKP